MAHFRGTLQGGRGEASRLGHKTSGLHVEAASWEGKVVVTLRHVDGKDVAEVRLAKHMGRGGDQLLYEGPISG